MTRKLYLLLLITLITVNLVAWAWSQLPAAQPASSMGTLRATRFELVDEQGAVLTVVGKDRFGNVGLFLPNESDPAAAIVVKDGMPLLIFRNKDGLATLSARPDGAGLAIGSKASELLMASSPEGASFLATLANSKASASLNVNPKTNVSSVHLISKNNQDFGFATDGTRRLP